MEPRRRVVGIDPAFEDQPIPGLGLESRVEIEDAGGREETIRVTSGSLPGIPRLS
jgi:hypothetical protein